MKKTVNSTGRKLIKKQHVLLGLKGPKEGPREVCISVELKEYKLPGNARIFFEASRQSTWMRFDLGTVAEPRMSEPLKLTELGSAQLTTFRLKIVEAECESGPAARILAQADRISPDAQADSLLAIEWNKESIGDELYRLEIGDPTVLRINEQLFDGRHWTTLTETDAFRSLVLPSILRQILTHTLIIEYPNQEPQGHLALWITLAEKIFGAGACPKIPDDDGTRDPEEVDTWINRAVEGFCKTRKMRDRATKFLDDGRGGAL